MVRTATSQILGKAEPARGALPDWRKLCALTEESNRFLATMAASRATDNSSQSLLKQIISELKTLQAVTIEPPRFKGDPEVEVSVVQVVTPGSIQSGPDLALPPGLVTTIRQRRHTSNRYGYVAFDDVDVRNTLQRVELRDGDSFTARIQNLSSIWFDTDTAGTFFEMIVEYAHERGRVNPIPTTT